MTAMTTDIQVPEGYVFACAVNDVPARGKRSVTLDHTHVLIIACESAYHAVEDVCPQTGRSIAHGEVLDCTLTTPTNGARYCLKTGRYLDGGQSPFQSHWLTVFPVHVYNDSIYVKLAAH